MRKIRPPNPLHELIHDATGAPPALIPIIEQVMREDIFHSTLDWQTAAELADGARQAYDLYCTASPYFNTWSACQAAVFKTMQANERLEKARKRGKPDSIIKAEQHLQFCQRRERELASMCRQFGEAFFGS